MIRVMGSRLASTAAGSTLKAGAKFTGIRSSAAVFRSSSLHAQYASFSNTPACTRLEGAQAGAIRRREMSTSPIASNAGDDKKAEELRSAESALASNPDNLKDEELLVAEIIRKIKADLIEADVNYDGKIDSEELKMVLRKYPEIFSDKDVVDIGQLFYAGRGGESVSHEKFMEAVANAVGKSEVDEEGGQHRRVGSISHPLGLGVCSAEYMFGKDRGVYTAEELDVKVTHLEPVTRSDKIAHALVGVVRLGFDVASLWKFGQITKGKIMTRVIFLETVAGVPGFVAAMNRHLKSLRTFQRDGGMLNMFLDEANNERMHLLSFVRMSNPGMFMRTFVLVAQCAVSVGFGVLYAFAPDFCHRFVGYIEEEACHTYTTIIDEIENCEDDNPLAEWRTELAPKIARGCEYYLF